MKQTETSSISIDDILGEATKLLDEVKIDKLTLKQNNISNVLDEILSYIEYVDFREYCELKGDNTKLKGKHFLVSVVEILLKVTDENGFSLCRKDGMIYLFNSEYWENIDQEKFKDFLGGYSGDTDLIPACHGQLTCIDYKQKFCSIRTVEKEQ